MKEHFLEKMREYQAIERKFELFRREAKERESEL